jgi:type III pantothenate kinase
MILAIDAGNTNIVVGCIDNEKIFFVERIATENNKTELQYLIDFKTILEIHSIPFTELDGAILSSVVPHINNVMIKAVEKLLGITPIIVGPGVKTGLNIFMDNPAQVGSDLIVNAVAGLKYYGAPLVIIDMGTATTISVLDEKKSYVGGVIIPGVMVSLNALVERTSQLPDIAVTAPRKVVGKNTIDSMKSGIVFSQASALDGMIDRIWEELEYKTAVVATGGMAGAVIPHCHHEIIPDNELTLKGLSLLYYKNRT